MVVPTLELSVNNIMQTFLPYPDFAQSAACLDNNRLGKQRVECLQILKALTDPSYGWQNHPAVKMWRGYHDRLVQYSYFICDEWNMRGFKDTCKAKIQATLLIAPREDIGKTPGWLGNPAFHASHRSNLLRKDPVHYGQFGWTEPNNLPYIWPTL